ncbi:MAG: hypothetical protein ACXAE3_04615 [Candidatus Kariarchaeaceae archaeon]
MVSATVPLRIRSPVDPGSTTVITEYVEEPQAAISPVPPITLLGLLVLPLFRRRTKE